DYSLGSTRPLTALSRWRLQSTAYRQFQPELPAPLRQQALHLPAGFNPRTLALGSQWRTDAGDDEAAIVQRALQWISGEFAYTLSTPLAGRHSADEFLFEQRAGFCEHFSSAFAVLMRSAGVPTRVVTGYAGGVRNRYGDYWLVRRMDAHAWNEVWLAGRGWVRVDPTAAVAPERILDTLDQRLADGQAVGDGLLPAISLRWHSLRQAGDWLRQRWNQQVLGYDAAAQARLLQRLRLDGSGLGRGLLAATWIASSGLAIALMWWALGRRRPSTAPLLDAWQALGRRHQRLG